jgi:hypothetical protein
MKTRLNRSTIRIYQRYSAALAVRWFRDCNRLGANFTRDQICEYVLANYGWGKVK